MVPNAQSNRLAFAIASFIVGGGLIALVVSFSVIPVMDLLMWAATVLLPIAAVAMGLGLISKGSLDMWRAATEDAQFSKRVRDWSEHLRKNPEATPESRRREDDLMYA